MGRVGVHTDMGTGNPSETLHRETIIDFGYRATHLSLLEAKRLAKEKYGRNEALIDWVEKGVAPASLEGRLKDGGTHSIAPLRAAISSH